MGVHAFDHEPQHCELYRRAVGHDLPRLHGLDERWNMLAARHRRALGDEAFFAGVDHYVLTYHIGGATARRLDGDRAWAEAGRGALSLQGPRSGGTFGSDGVVDYGHFYFRQALLCEVADEASLSEDAEVDDFFGVVDPSCSAEAQAYLQRAADGDDPPSPIEMDSRAYLMALSLLRAARRREGRTLQLTDDLSRPDLRTVLRRIEDDLSGPLRLSDLAQMIDMSPFHFSRVFKAEIGETPARYVLRRRTERAVEMIRMSDATLAEIAFRTGFSSQSHMTRQVKTLTGLTPGAIRSGG